MCASQVVIQRLPWGVGRAAEAALEPLRDEAGLHRLGMPRRCTQAAAAPFPRLPFPGRAGGLGPGWAQARLQPRGLPRARALFEERP
jgi:hypothetical protein